MNSYKNRGIGYLIATIIILISGMIAFKLTKENTILYVTAGVGSSALVSFIQKRRQTEEEFKDSKYQNDERYKFITAKSGSLAFYIVDALALIGLIVAYILDNDFGKISLSLIFVVGTFSFVILEGIYNKKM